MNPRNPNVFEKILLIIGVLIVIIGYSFIHRMYVLDGYALKRIDIVYKLTMTIKVRYILINI